MARRHRLAAGAAALSFGPATLRGLALGGALFALVGCGQNPPPLMPGPPGLQADTITVAVGPCFGFCPVYQASIAPGGAVSFSGTRHTAILGERRRETGGQTYRALAEDLAPFRPVDGTSARVQCDAAISDTSSYTITWTGPDGRQTIATHQRGCSSGPGQVLDGVLQTLTTRLGIADWAKQMTRPGESRG